VKRQGDGCHRLVTLARISEMSKGIVRDGKPKKRLSQAKIKKRRAQLRLLYGIEKSWRVISRDYYPEVTFQTLQAFADKGRNYVPANEQAREALDLYADHNPYRGLPRWYKRTPEALAFVTTKKEQIKQMQEEAKKQRKAVV